MGQVRLGTYEEFDPGLLSQGRSHLQWVQELARHPRYGPCWMEALRQLDGGCKELNEEQQSRIALAFAHCHLQRSGKKFPPCEIGSSIRDCTQHMDPVAFGVYTEFFTHAHAICYFLHHEAWQQQAQDTVHRLISSSETVAHQLESTNQLAEETARIQNATLRSQEQILRDGELLWQTLRDSSQGIHQAFQELQNSAMEQRVAFAEIFSRVAFLHRFVVGESNALYSVFFHLLSGVTALLLTSSQRTAKARLILLTLVGANVYLERVVCNVLLDRSEEGYDLTESISFWVGLTRRTFAGLCIAILAYFIWTYKDPAKQSQEVLQSLQETRKEIQQLLQETERLLANPELLFQDTKPRTEKEVSTDMGVSKLLFCSEKRAKMDAKEYWAEYQRIPSLADCENQSWAVKQLNYKHNLQAVDEIRTSSPRQRGWPSSQTHCSLSRRHRQSQNVATQLLTISIPVEGTPRYNLRRRQSLQDPDSFTSR
ncbi:protein GAMETE EXPRESSED 1-like isoform X2 [Thamnophis elegans]|uniref:protein GAMETE EXPRESSED 1-like isoform X2 n=1 Tax=Thamnophis elegans TaxID=35005 RepID=UPI0013781C69|nr:protein GAMETE EXPRESSED 1-like isoform X2 [Thamnophis elegans]